MQTSSPKTHRHFLCKLTWETHELLEDFRNDLQRHERRWISKRELVERAIRQLVASGKGAL